MDAVNEKHRIRAQSLYDQGDLRSDSRASSERTLLNMSDTELEDRGKLKDIEKAAADGVVVVTKDHVAPDPLARIKMIMWMVVNTLATVFIVSTG